MRMPRLVRDYFYYATATVILLTSNFGIAQTAKFVAAPHACSAAHCNNQNSDLALLPPSPTGSMLLKKWNRYGGSTFGLGCSSNGTRFACSFGPTTLTPATNVAVFDSNGNLLWEAPSAFRSNGLSGLASGSAPIIDSSGGIIATDEERIIRFDANGNMVWNTPHPSDGLPISPVLLDDGSLFLARKTLPSSDSASIVYYDSATGSLLAELLLTAPHLDGHFDTANTPATRGNRVYVLTNFVPQQSDDPNAKLGRMYAIDSYPNAVNVQDRLQVAWHFDFRAPSGASPTVHGNYIYFDGLGTDPSAAGMDRPTIFALEDMGSTYRVEYAFSPIAKQAQASFARDPRGGFWIYGLGETKLYRISDRAPGQILDTIEVGEHLAPHRGAAFGPTSALTIAGDASRPVLHFAVKTTTSDLLSPTYVFSMDLVRKIPDWLVQTSKILDVPAGQFPVVRDANGQSRVVFTTFFSGPYVIGRP